MEQRRYRTGAPHDRGMRIRLLNVKYSPNLGDGLLAECLEGALLELGAHPDTGSVDLAARTDFSTTLPGRRAAMTALAATPAPIRQTLLRAPLAYMARRKWRPHYRSGLSGAQAVIVGGGNLFTDFDLNFPTKLAVALEEAGRRGLPTAIYGVGVGRHWSRRGRQLFESAVRSAPIRAVYVRDEPSKRAWDQALAAASGHEAVVVRDPGLLACDHFPAPPRLAQSSPVVGLGLMSQIAIRYHAAAAPDRRKLDAWYLKLVRLLLDRGLRVTVFVNGSPEDRAYLDRLRTDMDALGAGDALTIRIPATPAELCATISGLDAVVAFRMHAIIAAYAYRIPAIGLAWDPKLSAFLSSIDRSASLLDLMRDPPERCAAMLDAALASDIPDAEHQRVIDEARAGIRRVFADLVPADAALPARSEVDAILPVDFDHIPGR